MAQYRGRRASRICFTAGGRGDNRQPSARLERRPGALSVGGGRAPPRPARWSFCWKRWPRTAWTRRASCSPIHYLYDNRYVADCLARYPTTFSGIAIMDRRAPDAVEAARTAGRGRRLRGAAHAPGPGRGPGGVGGARPGPDLAQGRGVGGLHAEPGFGGAAAGDRSDHRPPPRRQGDPRSPRRRPGAGRAALSVVAPSPRPGAATPTSTSSSRRGWEPAQTSTRSQISTRSTSVSTTPSDPSA